MATETNLSFNDGEFTFKGKPLRIFSGAMHYFRVMPEYWEDRLTKAKACGLNTIETYVPWNLHEPRPGHYKNDGILDLRKFIQTAADLDLHVIFRPGPYICSEWDFGGLPSWLLADPDMKVRSNYQGYQAAVERYFSWLLPQVLDLQSSQGGPIFAVQIENEYGSFSFDPAHLLWLRELLLKSGVTELLVTSDNETCAKGMRSLTEKRGEGGKGGEAVVDLFNLPGVLPTANGMTVFEVQSVFDEIRRNRGGKSTSRPLMVMELWSGWFDYWGAGLHETTTARSLEETVRYAFSRDASINLYMLHGGTNFGFMNGALQLPPDAGISSQADPSDSESYPYRADVTSYDYDAPIAEDGSLTEKFLVLRRLIIQEKERLGAITDIPAVPTSNNRARCPLVVGSWGGDSGEVLERLAWDDLLSLVSKKTEEKGDPRWMEMYEYPGGEVQSYGYVVYRKFLAAGSDCDRVIAFTGRVRDNGNILVDGLSVGQVDWSQKDASVSLGAGGQDLCVVVENMGRVNYTTSDNQARLNMQRRGVSGPVSLDGKPLQEWDVLALDFEDGFVDRALQSDKWTRQNTTSSVAEDKTKSEAKSPALYRGVVKLTAQPADYFLRLEGWHKGVVFVNGFNLGRYCERGPTKTLYLPGPVLRQGENQVVVFEEESAGGQIVLGIEPQLA